MYVETAFNRWFLNKETLIWLWMTYTVQGMQGRMSWLLFREWEKLCSKAESGITVFYVLFALDVLSTHLLLWQKVNVGGYLYQRVCRDGAGAQYMQYLRKSSILHHKCVKCLFKRLVFLFECLSDQQDSCKCPKATRRTAKYKSVRLQKCHLSSSC